MHILNNNGLILLATLIISQPTFGLSSLSTEKPPELSNMVQRIDSLERQVRILEDNLPKRIRKLPLDLPHLTSNGAVQETMSRLYELLSLNFIDYHLQINNNRQYCTQESFSQYVHFLKDSKWVDEVAKNKMLLYIRPSTAPQIIKEGAQNNIYSWQIKIPFNAYLENINETKTIPMTAVVEIQRASELAHPLGILITNIDIKKA